MTPVILPFGRFLALLVVKKQTESDSVLEPSDAAAINGTLRTSAGPDSIRTDLIMFGQLFALGDKSRVCRSRSQLFYVEPIIESHCEWSSRRGGARGETAGKVTTAFCPSEPLVNHGSGRAGGAETHSASARSIKEAGISPAKHLGERNGSGSAGTLAALRMLWSKKDKTGLLL